MRLNRPDIRLPATHAALKGASAQQCCTSLFIRRKAATDNMLHIVEAHPNWSVCAVLMRLSIHLHGLRLAAQYSQT